MSAEWTERQITELMMRNLHHKLEIAEGVEVREVRIEREGPTRVQRTTEWEAFVEGESVSDRKCLRSMLEWLDGWITADSTRLAGRGGTSDEWAQHLQDTYDEGKADALDGYEERIVRVKFGPDGGVIFTGEPLRILVPTASPEPDKETP